jgi:hypothetical protein
MSRAAFESAVRDATRDGGAVRVNEIAAKVGVSREEAKGYIDAMYAAGELELDLDGDDFVYRRKRKKGDPLPPSRIEVSPAPKPVAKKRAPEPEPEPDEPEEKPVKKGKEKSVIDSAKEAATGALVPIRDTLLKEAAKEAAKRALGGDDEPSAGPKKSMAWGVGLGLLLPGAGLFYSAPWITAILATVAVGLVMTILSYLPIIGPALTYIVFGLFMVASGGLGAIYTYQFNKTGKRTRLSKATEDRKALPF